MPTSLIDDVLPLFDVRERHATRVRAEPDVVYASIRRTDLARPFPVRVLLVLRALPGALERMVRGNRTALLARASAPVTLREFEAHGFSVLAESPPRELVVGLVGRFWTLGGDLCRDVDAARFRQSEPGTARSAWNFEVTPIVEGGCELATETRVHCADAAARRRFLPYWLLIRPFSGMIRRLMLREIRREAEATSAVQRRTTTESR